MDGVEVGSIAGRTITVDGKSYNTVYFSEKDQAAWQSAGKVKVEQKRNGEIVATYHVSFGVGCYNYAISSDDTIIPYGDFGGRVDRAVEGDIITLEAKPKEGYQLKAGTLKVTGASGKEVQVSDNKFTMPDEAVTVTAEFEAVKYKVDHYIYDGVPVMGNVRISVDGELQNENGSEVHADVAVGATVTVTFEPFDGYEVSEDPRFSVEKSISSGDTATR